MICFIGGGGVGYGDAGNDELRATAEHGGTELHGGSGDDKVNYCWYRKQLAQSC
jgi:hypothetical protein